MFRSLVVFSCMVFIAFQGIAAFLPPLPVTAQQSADTMRSPSQEACSRFPETGFQVCGRLLEYWQQNDGLRVFGLPIGPQQQMTIEGRTFQAQWFERNRLELHPDNAPPYDVLLGRLGVDTLEHHGRDWHTFPASAALADCRFFPETRQNVCGAFLRAWRANGLELDGKRGTSEAESLALFGMPLGEPQQELLSDGQWHTVQWFERTRFELHPQNAPPYDVLFGLLGNELQTPTIAPPGTPTPAPTATPTAKPTPVPTTTPTAKPTATPAQPQPDATGRIAFLAGNQQEYPTGNAIYTVKPDGSGVRRVSITPPYTPENPWFLIMGYDWSLDGRRFAFSATNRWETGLMPVGTYSNSPDIYTVYADGTDQMRLTNDGHNPWEVAIAPDGTRVAAATPDSEDLVVMRSNGSQRRIVTDTIPELRWISNPAWSPDGRQIAFVAAPNATATASEFRVYRAMADGSSVVPLSDLVVTDMTRLVWSPDGKRLVITPTNSGTIYLINADGRGLREVAALAGVSSGVVWSPDGRWLLFDEHSRETMGTLFLVASDGGEPVPIVTSYERIDSVAWSPDGRAIAFAAMTEETDNTFALYVISFNPKDPGAGSPRQIAWPEGGVSNVVWR
jgi:dipeptidyl aminopeptidase/acylaminoacyl peptidase